MKKITLETKYKLSGWGFVMPAAIMIFIFSFYPMVRSFFLSLQAGLGNNLRFAGLRNYIRLFQDEKFLAAVSYSLTKNGFIFSAAAALYSDLSFNEWNNRSLLKK